MIKLPCGHEHTSKETIEKSSWSIKDGIGGITIYACKKCKYGWSSDLLSFSEEGYNDLEPEEVRNERKKREEEHMLEIRKRKKWRNGKWKMTRWMERFEYHLYSLNRKWGWKWTQLRYKFMQ